MLRVPIADAGAPSIDAAGEPSDSGGEATSDGAPDAPFYDADASADAGLLPPDASLYLIGTTHAAVPAGNLTLPALGPASSGDLLLAATVTRAVDFLEAPPGWVLITSGAASSADEVFYKVATPADTGPFVFKQHGTVPLAGVLAHFRNIDVSQPFADYATISYGGGECDLRTPVVTPDRANGLFVAFYYWWTATPAGVTWTTPPGFTADDGSTGTIFLTHAAVSTPGAMSSFVSTCSAADMAGGGASLLVLEPRK